MGVAGGSGGDLVGESSDPGGGLLTPHKWSVACVVVGCVCDLPTPVPIANKPHKKDDCPAKEFDHRESIIRLTAIRLTAHYGFAHAGIGKFIGDSQ